MTQVKEKMAELLFLLAKMEVRSEDAASGARGAIALLDEAQLLVPTLRASTNIGVPIGRLSATRKPPRPIPLGRNRSSAPSGSTTTCTHQLSSAGRYDESRREIQTAIALRVDDYWSWSLWGANQKCPGRNGDQVSGLTHRDSPAASRTDGLAATRRCRASVRSTPFRRS